MTELIYSINFQTVNFFFFWWTKRCSSVHLSCKVYLCGCCWRVCYKCFNPPPLPPPPPPPPHDFYIFCLLPQILNKYSIKIERIFCNIYCCSPKNLDSRGSWELSLPVLWKPLKTSSGWSLKWTFISVVSSFQWSLLLLDGSYGSSWLIVFVVIEMMHIHLVNLSLIFIAVW